MGCFLSFFIILFVIIFFAIISTGLNIVSYILRLFGINIGNPSSKQNNSHSQTGNENHQHGRTNPQNSQNTKKIIDDDEGEYVDFEEVK